MPDRRWTILLVSPRNEPARELKLPSWGFRAMAWTGGIGTLLVGWAVVVLFTSWGTPGSRLVSAQNAALQQDIASIEVRFAELSDTLRAIAVREEQMRMLAGLPIDRAKPADSSELVGPQVASLADAEIADGRAIAGRLGWSARPDIDGLISKANTLASDFRDVSDTLERNYARFANTPSIMPTAGWLSSQFSRSRFHPILHENRPHEGIDVTAPTGTPIVAPAGGRVVLAGNDKGYGLVVEIDHGNGIRTRFAHCSRLAVRTGQIVTRNQLIAAVGSTGLSTAPHLHYEIHVNGKPVDPLTYVLPDAAN
jgi:murein DD-endopeptidase MepM/ murein hydrolase activator NlpD